MESMTVSVVAQQRNKVAAQLDRARRTHGAIGRSGSTLDNTDLVRRLERQLSDWERLLSYAQSD